MIRYTILDRPGEHLHIARWRGRCTFCGHRVGPDVIETRRRPWRIPSEIVGRYRAMRQPRPPIYDLDDEDDPDTLESMHLL